MSRATSSAAGPQRRHPRPRRRSFSRDRTAGASNARDAFYCVQDAADYFRLVRRALLDARDTVFILGWDTASTVDLDPGGDATEAPTRLDELIAFVTAASGPAVLHPDLGLRLALHTRARAVDALAAGMAHAAARAIRLRRPSPGRRQPPPEDHRRRRSAGVLRRHRSDGSSLGHERASRRGAGAKDATRAAIRPVSRSAAHGQRTGRGQPGRARARSLAGARRRATAGARRVSTRLVAVRRRARSDRCRRRDRAHRAAIRKRSRRSANARRCFAIRSRAATRTIYIENQYFTDDGSADALAARLREPDGPEVVIVAPKECHGWLERQSMGAFRDAVFAH